MPFLAAIPAALGSAMGAVGSGLGAAAGGLGSALGAGAGEEGLGTLAQLGLGAAKGLTGGLRQQQQQQSQWLRPQQIQGPSIGSQPAGGSLAPQGMLPQANEDYIRWLMSQQSPIYNVSPQQQQQ